MKGVIALLLASMLFASGFMIGNVTHGPWVVTVERTELQTIVSTAFRTVTEPSPAARTIYVPFTVTVGATSPAIGGWREVTRFSGSSYMTTEPFHVPATMWRIKWSYGTSQYAGFGFFVYLLGQEYSVESVSSSGPSGSSVTYIYKGLGDFYLKILAANIQYTIIVEAPA